MPVRQIPLYANAEPRELPETVESRGPVMLGHDVGTAQPSDAYVLGFTHGVCLMLTLTVLAWAVRFKLRQNRHPLRKRVEFEYE